MKDEDLLTGPQAEKWFREFAERSGILSKLEYQSDSLVKLLNSELSYRFGNGRTFIDRDLPLGEDWIHEILSGRTPAPFTQDNQDKLSQYLLDKVVATDDLITIRDNSGVLKTVAVDVTTNPKEETEKLHRIQGKPDPGDGRGYNRNANLPAVRKRLKIDKHFILVISNDRQRLPSPEKLTSEIEKFVNGNAITKSLNLVEVPEQSRYKWNETQAIPKQSIATNSFDPKQMWQRYSKSQSINKVEIAKQTSLKAIQAGHQKDSILEMLRNDPQYQQLRKSKPEAADNYLMTIYTSSREKFELDKAKDPNNQKLNIQALKASRFIVNSIGKSNGDERTSLGNLLLIRQTGNDLRIDTTIDNKTVLNYQNGMLKGSLTMEQLKWLKGWANAIQADKQREKRGKDTGLEQ